MNRLKKIADNEKQTFNTPEDLSEREPSLEEARQLAQETGQKIDEMVKSFHNLYESLNKLTAKYPGLYDEIKLVCKFPNENVAEDIAQMNEAFDNMFEHLQDDHYLGNIIGLMKDE